MKKILILSALAVGFTVQAQNFDPITVTNVPPVTSHTAANGNTNFNSSLIYPNGRALTVWIRTVGTNATTSGTVTYQLFGAIDRTNFTTTPIVSLAQTLNGTNPVVTRYFLAATNFYGIEAVKFGAITNASTNYNRTTWIKVAREKD